MRGETFDVPTWLSPVALLILWQGAAWAGLIDTNFFPAPISVLLTLGQMVTTSEFWGDVGISLQRVVVGLLMGGIPGVAVGLLTGLFHPADRLISPLVSLLYPIPKIAILPLILLIFGLGEMSKYLTIAFGVFFLMAINTHAGVQNIRRIYFDVAENLKIPRSSVYFSIALPGALPGIFTGLRLATGVAFILLVSAEFVGANNGLGYRIWWCWTVFRVDQMYACLIVISLLGLSAALLVAGLERRLVPWRSDRGSLQ